MPLITGLEIENFRCFQKLTVGGLTRVNLIVGANNSGKTALLEAVEIVAAEDPVVAATLGLRRRGEWATAAGSNSRLDLSALLFGRDRFTAGVSGLRIFANGATPRGVSVGFVDQPDEKPRLYFRADSGQELWVSIVSGRYLAEMDFDLLASLEHPGDAARFVGSGVPIAADIHRLWALTAGTSAQDSAERALRLIEPELDQLVIAPPPGGGTLGFQGIYFRLKSRRERVGVAGYGEGIKRLVALGLSLGACDGTLLIDEIENGIHYSVLPRLWRFLVEAARELDVQVFTTTHSKDCLEAIAELYRSAPELAQDISIHRLDAGAERSVDTDAATAMRLSDINVELR